MNQEGEGLGLIVDHLVQKGFYLNLKLDLGYPRLLKLHQIDLSYI